MPIPSPHSPRSGSLKFVIWAPSFDDASGGTIALHYLCHRLNKAGHRALLWPSYRIRLTVPPRPGALWWQWRAWWNDWKGQFRLGPFPNELAQVFDLRDAIAIYPEIISGNPLRAKHVVRWLLHRPGHWTGRSLDHGPDDLFFFFQDAFNDPSINPDPDARLLLSWINEVYRDHGRTDRQGSCYIVRKGKGRPIAHDLQDSIQVDDLTHAQKAEVFNRCLRFYTYDPYTMYSQYAAMCGCVPIIVPEAGVSKEEWLPSEEERFGLAYGEEEIDWAIATRSALFDRIGREYQAEEEMISRFVDKCRNRFATADRRS